MDNTTAITTFVSHLATKWALISMDKKYVVGETCIDVGISGSLCVYLPACLHVHLNITGTGFFLLVISCYLVGSGSGGCREAVSQENCFAFRRVSRNLHFHLNKYLTNLISEATYQVKE